MGANISVVKKDFSNQFKMSLDNSLGMEYSEDIWFQMGMDFGAQTIFDRLISMGENIVYESWIEEWKEFKDEIDVKIGLRQWVKIGKKIWLNLINMLKVKYNYDSLNNYLQ